MTKDLEKALKDYKPIFDRPTPVRYDVLYFNDDHRRMDALLRRHYDSFHPLVKDIFTSFSLEFSLLLEKVENMTKETEELREEFDQRKKILDEGLDERIQELNKEKEKLEDEIKQKDQKIDDLEGRVDQLEKILMEKEALIVTQRRQLDLYIENEANLAKEKKTQEETIYQSIEHVNEFTTELENIEAQMKQLEAEKHALLQENQSLKAKISETENQYITEIDEITELYTNLKSEFAKISGKISDLENEKNMLENQLAQEQNQEQLEKLIQENQELQLQLSKLYEELEKKNAEIEELENKQNKFREVAAKLLQFKDQIEEQYHETKKFRDGRDKETHGEILHNSPITRSQDEDVSTKIVHPADKINKKKKWKPKKSQLELEIEGKVDPEEHMHDKVIDSSTKLVENVVNLDQSVSRIAAALSKNSSSSDLLNAIKKGTKPTSGDLQEEEEQLTNRLMTELMNLENDEELTENDVIEKSENFKKVLQRLEGKDLNLLDRFAIDFPMPPEAEEAANQGDKDSKDKNSSKKETESNSLSA